MTAADGAASDFPAALFERQDNSADSLFYEQPRFVTHIDDATIAALTEFYREFIPQNADVLDLMSSWISHLPAEVSYNSVTGHGMNAEELSANPRLSRHFVQDLNADPQLPVESQSIDCALIVVSIQYLIQPVPVMRELYRTLRAGGRLCIAMSHRCFPTKAIRAFTQLSPQERMQLVITYLDRSGFTEIEFVDRSPANADPLWLVTGTRREP